MHKYSDDSGDPEGFVSSSSSSSKYNDDGSVGDGPLKEGPVVVYEVWLKDKGSAS